MSMKRLRDENGEVEKLAMANCLMILSHLGKPGPSSRIFKCKTCKQQFPSFQALGGHRAGHKRPKLMAPDLLNPAHSPVKSKTHQCSICRVEYPTGQALGGHMRRHRATVIDDQDLETFIRTNASQSSKAVPVLKKSNSSKRVFGLDLNLVPSENDLYLGW